MSKKKKVVILFASLMAVAAVSVAFYQRSKYLKEINFSTKKQQEDGN